MLALAFEKAAAEVGIRPSRHNQNLRRARLQPRQEIVDVPLPHSGPHPLAVSVFAPADWVVDYPDVAAPAGQRTANPDGEVLAAPFGLPAASGTAIGCNPDAEDIAVRRAGADVAHAAAEPLGELLRVRGRDHRMRRVAPEIPSREYHRGIRRFGRSRRKIDHQPAGIAALYRLQLAQDQPMMKRRENTQFQVCNVLLDARPRLIPAQQFLRRRFRLVRPAQCTSPRPQLRGQGRVRRSDQQSATARRH